MEIKSMDTMETILTRRSIRKYRSKPVSNSLIKKLIKAAMSAPSAGNEQPWHFIIIDKQNILKAIPKFHPYAEMLNSAQNAILICADTTQEKHKGFAPIDCAAATENLLLAAHANGLGACWLGVYPSKDKRISNLRKLLKIPTSIIPFAIVAIGYPAEHKPIQNRNDESRIHWNNW